MKILNFEYKNINQEDLTVDIRPLFIGENTHGVFRMTLIHNPTGLRFEGNNNIDMAHMVNILEKKYNALLIKNKLIEIEELYKNKLLDILAQKWSTNGCNMCNENDWDIQDKLLDIKDYKNVNNTNIEDHLVSSISVTCNNCGNILSINPRKAGLIDCNS